MAITFAILAVIVGIAQLILTFRLFFRNSGDYIEAWQHGPWPDWRGAIEGDFWLETISSFKLWFYHLGAVFSGIAVYFGLMKFFA